MARRKPPADDHKAIPTSRVGRFARVARMAGGVAGGMLADQEGIYALQVSGTSMIDDLINDGDIVVMKHQSHANNGDMVAARLRDENETTLKRFYLEGEQVRLQPANPLMEPIYVPTEQVEVQAADQLAAVCFRRGLQALGFQSGEHEVVDGVAYGAGCVGNGWARNRLQRPPGFVRAIRFGQGYRGKEQQDQEGGTHGDEYSRRSGLEATLWRRPSGRRDAAPEHFASR